MRKVNTGTRVAFGFGKIPGSVCVNISVWLEIVAVIDRNIVHSYRENMSEHLC